jgi:hypothetical protein
MSLDPKIKKGQVCEANFYTGELALQRGDKGPASIPPSADCPNHEWFAANAELKAQYSRKAAQKIVPPRPRTPFCKGLGAEVSVCLAPAQPAIPCRRPLTRGGLAQ